MTDNLLSDFDHSSGSRALPRKVVALAEQNELETTSHLQDKSHSEQKVRDEGDNDSNVSRPPLSSCSQETNPETPKKATRFRALDTPRANRVQDGPSYKSSYVENQRVVLLASLGWECFSDTIEYFFDHVLPPLRPELNVDDIFKKCKEKKLLAMKGEKFKWCGFSDDPCELGKHETEIYNTPLKRLFNGITKIAEKLSTPPGATSTALPHKSNFQPDGRKSTWSERKIASKPDAHVFMINPHRGYPKKGKHWYNVACSFQFKKVDKKYKRYENLGQIIHNLQECMSHDVCRRFALGITIEGTSMRVWILSRSFLIASDSFDFNSDPKTFIKVVLSLMFSDKGDLGWDPAIEDRYDGKERVYTITVAQKRYCSSTKDLLEEVKAEGLYTTGTRIFKVFEESDKEKEKPLILKDYWPTIIHDTEFDIRSKILANIKDLRERELVKRALLTPTSHELVKVGGHRDHTRNVILRGKSPSKKYQFEVPNSVNGQKSDSKTGPPTGFSMTTNDGRQEILKQAAINRCSSILHRKHCRIVYKEDAKPYYKLNNIKDTLLVLEHSINALRVIHKAGWFHRDLSPANLYLYKDPETNAKRGIIGDLEFAKKVGTGASSDVRTCSPLFMSIEIAQHEYQFMDFKNRYTYDSSCGIHANYLHDLESIFWILIWTIFVFRKKTESPDSESVCSQKDASSQLFSGSRTNFLRTKHSFDEIMGLTPGYFGNLKKLATTFKDHLIRVYCEEENRITTGVPIMLPKESVHDLILEAFRSYTIPNGDAGLMLTLIQRHSSLKRSTPDEDSETDDKETKKQRTCQSSNDAIRIV